MQPHQQRVVDEKLELDEKLQKLEVFIAGAVFNTLGEDEQKRLREQARHMWAYSDVLGRRIAAF